MEPFGNILAYIVVEVITLIHGTLSGYVNITTVDGNVTNISLSNAGEAFCLNWGNLIVSFAGAMDTMMTVLWSVR